MRKFLFTLLFISNIAFAIDKVFIREYTYKASDYDSKITSRVNALEQVTEQLLREVGVYIKSETQWDRTETSSGFEEIYEKKMDIILILSQTIKMKINLIQKICQAMHIRLIQEIDGQ